MPPQDDLAQKFREFEFKPGTGGFPHWEGMERDGTPTQIANNRPRLVINGRYRNGDIVSRGGQTPISGVLDPPSCRSIFDQQIDKPIQLLIIMAGCPGAGGAVGTGGVSCNFYDQEQEPQLQRTSYYVSSLIGANMQVFADKVFLSVDNALKRYTYTKVAYGIEIFTVASILLERPVHTFTNTISALRAFDGKLFIAEANGASSKIWTYDGLTLLDDTGGSFSADPTGFGLYRDFIIVGYGAAANKISYRRAGPSGSATWTDVSGAADGMIDYGIEYKDKFYFVGGDEDVWVFDGTNITSALNIAGVEFNGVEKANGYLYVCYTDSGVGKIARYDGSSWVNAHKTFTGQLDTADKIAWFRNSIYVYGEIGGGFDVLISPNVNTSGTYISMQTQTALGLRRVLKMQRIDF